MPRSPEQARQSPKEIAKIEKKRIISDAELLIGGAKYKIDERGDKVLVLEPKQVRGIENERTAKENERMEKRARKKERASKIANDFMAGYQPSDLSCPEQIVRMGETPEAYIYNGRRIVKNSLEIITEKLLETGKVQKVYRDAKFGKFPGVKEIARIESGDLPNLFRLKTNDPIYERFVNAVNGILDNYPDFYKGSFDVLKNEKFEM